MPSQELYSDNKKNLVVYRASAGSGKTHRLTGEYLRLIFAYPLAYKHVLAVTFTNKATDEMKVRIIEELYKLASDKKSDHLRELMDEKSESEAKIRERAKTTLNNILHDYSAFAISTIDRFFQQTMRAFTREIGLGGGYSVELDQTKVLREAVEGLLSDLEKSDNQQLLDWLIRFSEEKVENGETWNIRNDIQTLSEEIFKENYKAFSDKIQKSIADKEFLDRYKKTLMSIITTFEKQSREIAQKAQNIIERFGVSFEDLKNKGRSPLASFTKLAQGEVIHPTNSFINLAGDFDNWVNKTASPESRTKVENAYNAGLNECVCQIIELYGNSVLYQTAFEISRYYFTLGILSDVDKKVREYTAENNIMLISDTTELLHKIIEGSDSPFIYEKIGTYINHYMIDEFQDTSGMQWSNFRPLIKDSLSAGYRNLIVGDVKQSIYRWRNSDWKLLDQQLDEDFRLEGIDHQSLAVNWRSLANIVNFNNFVFESSAKLLQDEFNESISETADNRVVSLSEKIKTAYKGLRQEVAPNKQDEGGYVEVQFIDGDKQADWQASVLEGLPHSIERLQDKGYRLKDIAILVRTKKEGAEIANTLLNYKEQHSESKYKYDIISDEALFVGNSNSIKLTVSLLKHVQNPSDLSLQSLALQEYYKTQEQLSTEQAIQKQFSSSGEFPNDIRTELDRIRELPLYEMVEGVFTLFRQVMDEKENVYIQSFLDMILDFTIRYSSDLDAFLQWWDETGSGKTIFTPDGQDAIRIMTIHKSKGLGFEAVIIPFCNWEIDHKLSTILWCQPKTEPFNQLDLVPVKYSQKLKNTIFEYEYFNEKLHAYVDNLNIMYVAFTRAKSALIAYSPKPNNDKISNIASLLWSGVGASGYFDEESNRYIIGEDFLIRQKEREEKNNELKINTLTSIPYDRRLKLRLNNKYYFSEKGKREYGTLMHEIISKIDSVDDLDDTLDSYFIAGDINSDERIKIKDIIGQYLAGKHIGLWYSGQYKVLNEVEILQPNGTFVRPDRVMMKGDEVIVIDYKFGEKENNNYIKQVKYYASQIKKMGYENVKGYICYIVLDKIVEVK